MIQPSPKSGGVGSTFLYYCPMHKLALHQITMMEGGPEGLVRFAAAAGLDGVCLFTATPLDSDGRDMFPVVEPAAAASFRRLLRDHQLRILAAELGARRLVTHIHDTGGRRAEDQLSRLCVMAGEQGLDVGLEFTGFAGGCNSLASAVALHGRVDQPNLGIAIDALHLVRTGGTLDQVQAVDPAIIAYAQLCDGPDFRIADDYIAEAMHRMIPGEGVFPLRKLVALLGPHVDIDVEVPGPALATGRDARARARSAIAASRELFAERTCDDS